MYHCSYWYTNIEAGLIIFLFCIFDVDDNLRYPPPPPEHNRANNHGADAHWAVESQDGTHSRGGGNTEEIKNESISLGDPLLQVQIDTTHAISRWTTTGISIAVPKKTISMWITWKVIMSNVVSEPYQHPKVRPQEHNSNRGLENSSKYHYIS